MNNDLDKELQAVQFSINELALYSSPYLITCSFEKLATTNCFQHFEKLAKHSHFEKPAMGNRLQ